MAGEQSECINESSHQKPKFLTLEAVKKLTVSPDSPQGILFFQYDSPELFRGSDFFKHYYNLGPQELQFSFDDQIRQLYGIDQPNPYNKALQRMLVILGYMKQDDFSGNFCDLEPDTPCEDKTIHQWRYLGVFGEKTRDCIKDFQRDNCIDVSGKVDDATKLALYDFVYRHFHSSEKQKYIAVTRRKIRDLQ